MWVVEMVASTDDWKVDKMVAWMVALLANQMVAPMAVEMAAS